MMSPQRQFFLLNSQTAMMLATQVFVRTQRTSQRDPK